jgi:hypothetical protein
VLRDAACCERITLRLFPGSFYILTQLGLNNAQVVHVACTMPHNAAHNARIVLRGTHS